MLPNRAVAFTPAAWGVALFFSWVAVGTPELAQGAQKATTHTIFIEGVQFNPTTVEVKVGDTVVWVNKDMFPHTATATGRFDSGVIAVGRSWSYKVKSKGSVPYICTLHPNMKASLIVR